MTSSTIVRLAALLASTSTTFALLQSIAMLGLPPGGEPPPGRSALAAATRGNGDRSVEQAARRPAPSCDDGQASMKAIVCAPSPTRG